MHIFFVLLFSGQSTSGSILCASFGISRLQSLTTHIKCWSWVKNPSREALHSLIQSFVHCRLDYCNSALAGVSKVYLQKLQSVQNTAARMVSGVRRCEHITPVLEDLHWLPISQRVVLKTALLVWKCICGVAPVYLRDLCIPAAFVEGSGGYRNFLRLQIAACEV